MKITLPSVTNGNNLSVLNQNFQTIADQLNNNVLYRKDIVGEPNQMVNTNLDMNANDILNAGTVYTDDLVVSGTSIETQVENAAASATSANASALSATESAATASAAASDATATLASTLKKASNLSDVVDPVASLANIGGVTSAQASAAAPVQKVAGRTGNVVLAVADVSGAASTASNLSDLASASSARGNLGLGTLATQNSNAVAITGGSVAGTPISGSSGSFTTVQTSSNVGLGTAPSASVGLQVSLPITGATSAQSINNSPTIQSGVTTSASINYSSPSTAAAAFTVSEINHYDATFGTLGSGSAVTNQYGYRVRPTLVGATNNYGFRGQIPAATGRWNIYMDGTANNYLAGNLQIGSSSATAGAENLQVGGSLSISSATLIRTYTTFTNGAAAATGTLTNAPVSGNPTKWIPINDNGTIRYLPAW